MASEVGKHFTPIIKWLQKLEKHFTPINNKNGITSPQVILILGTCQNPTSK